MVFEDLEDFEDFVDLVFEDLEDFEDFVEDLVLEDLVEDLDLVLDLESDFDFDFPFDITTAVGLSSAIKTKNTSLHRTPTGVIDQDTCTDNFLYRQERSPVTKYWQYCGIVV